MEEGFKTVYAYIIYQDKVIISEYNAKSLKPCSWQFQEADEADWAKVKMRMSYGDKNGGRTPIGAQTITVLRNRRSGVDVYPLPYHKFVRGGRNVILMEERIEIEKKASPKADKPKTKGDVW